jgi:uncharacterized protein (DUF362 family)
MKPTTDPRVILRNCETYDAQAIRKMVREAIEELGLRPSGRVLVKPNLVSAGPLFPHAHTRPEVGEGVLWALKDTSGPELIELAVGERCGITIPTRQAFSQSGFEDMVARVPGVKKYYFEECQQVEISYTHEPRLRDYVFTPEPVARADFFVNMPKFKAHPWTTVTFGCKNYIGIQDDRHRLIDHDHRLNEKIADLQHIIQPQLLVIDAITAGEGRMLTPTPFPLKLLIIGNNQVAFDAVCCSIIGVRARDVEHIRFAEDHGFGTTDLAKIKLSGDVTLAEAQARAKGFKVGLIRVEKYFEGTAITAYAGPPPEAERTEYCWGGCPGAIEEAIEILRQFDKKCDAKMKRLHVVFGAYRGAIDAKPGEKVVFIGDCANWEGRLGEQVVSVPNLYKNRLTKDPYHIKHDDIFAKLVSVKRKVMQAKKEPHLRLEGCPVSVAEQVLMLTELGGVRNPILSAESIAFNKAYLTWRLVTSVQRVFGKKYQRSGPAVRGQAMPDVTPRAS